VDGRISVGVSCTIRVTLKDGTFHEDVGYGSIENAKSKGMAFEKVKKEGTRFAISSSYCRLLNIRVRNSRDGRH
jgi:DNA recombination protein Rad52